MDGKRAGETILNIEEQKTEGGSVMLESGDSKRRAERHNEITYTRNGVVKNDWGQEIEKKGGETASAARGPHPLALTKTGVKALFLDDLPHINAAGMCLKVVARKTLKMMVVED